MSESKYESKVCSIPCDAKSVYTVLSNLKNLEKVRDLLPADKVQELEISEENIRMKLNGLGQKVSISIVDKKINDTLKFGVDNSPIPMNFWIQLKEVSAFDTRIRLTLHADIPFMFKMMIDKKLQQGLDEAARMLTRFPYTQWIEAEKQ